MILSLSEDEPVVHAGRHEPEDFEPAGRIEADAKAMGEVSAETTTSVRVVVSSSGGMPTVSPRFKGRCR